MELLKIDIPQTIIIAVVVLVVFFLIREIICWYYKINETLEELKMINKNLTSLIDKMDERNNEEEGITFKPEK